MKKGWLIGSGVVVAALAVYFVFFHKAKPNETGVTGDVLTDRAIMLANKIHAAMNIAGTDWTQLKGAFLEINDGAEFARIINAFGQRPYENWLHGLPSWLYADLNLTQWIQEETTDSERAELQQILVSKGINYPL